MFRSVPARLFAVAFFCASSVCVSSVRAEDILTLDAAIDRALVQSPAIQASEAALAAGEGEREQATAMPNPLLQGQAENFAGQNIYRGANTAEFTLGVSQLVEIGGKREARKAIAEQGLELSRRDLLATRLDIIRDVSIAYMDATMAEANLHLAEEQETLADQFLKEVNRRVAAAAVPLVQQSKSEVTVATARYDHARALRELEHARHLLASLLGGHHEVFVLDNAAFYKTEAPPSEGILENALAKNPDMQRWEAQKARSKAMAELAEANAIPDPTVSFGVRELRGQSDGAFGTEDSHALVAGLSIPIPVFNSNRGNITKAHHEIRQAESGKAAAALALRNAAYQSFEDMVNAYAQAQSLKDTILPASEKSYNLAREGYGLGRFSYLEVLDAQRTWFEARAQYLMALKEYHTAQAQVARHTAQHAERPTTKIAEAPHAE